MKARTADIWVQGAGELASGVAWRLARCGYGVITAEIANPLAVRRLVAFGEAVYEGRVEVEGIAGIRCAPAAAEYRSGQVAVVVDPRAGQLARLGASAVIDARMTKKAPEPLPTGDWLRIGLGPGFTAGQDVDFVIETHRQARLGSVIERGTAAANTGVPGVLGGESARRVVYSPAAGRLEPLVRIGELVAEGQVLGRVAGRDVVSRLSGRLRGLVHPLAELSPGVKVGDVDPRGDAIDPARISDKALAIAGGVLEALLRARIPPGG